MTSSANSATRYARRRNRHDPHRARRFRCRRHAADQGQDPDRRRQARGARLHEAGIGFTIISSRPTIGMRFLIEPLAITLPVGAFNGSSIVDPQLNPIEQHLIPPRAAQRSLDVLNEFGVDIWLFTNDHWLTRNPDGEYVPHEKRAIKHDPTIVDGFHALSVRRLQDRRRQFRCGAAAALRGRDAEGGRARRPPRCARRPIISTSRRPAATRAPSCEAMAKRLGISTDAVATIGDMQNDLRDVRDKRRLVRDGQRHRRRQEAGDACHDVERGRGICRGDRDDFEE